jgi:hypothetical protein
MFNDCRLKSGAELSEYQKRIENIENVILCVSEAEKMIRQIGSDLLSEELEIPQKRRSSAYRCKSISGFRSDIREPQQDNTAIRFIKRRIIAVPDVE